MAPVAFARAGAPSQGRETIGHLSRAALRSTFTPGSMPPSSPFSTTTPAQCRRGALSGIFRHITWEVPPPADGVLGRIRPCTHARDAGTEHHGHGPVPPSPLASRGGDTSARRSCASVLVVQVGTWTWVADGRWRDARLWWPPGG